jgi:hypothetical protein
MKAALIVGMMISSCFVQNHFNFNIKTDFISALLSVFSIIFGFYITSFAVFATSKFLSKLYKLESAKDNRKTLLDELLEQFNFAAYFLLVSIIYLIIAYVIIDNEYSEPYVYFLYILWAFITLNLIFAFQAISVFTRVTRKSAIES